jgi:hypothetical protein
MKISEFTDNSHIDEISAGEVGAGIGKATRAVGSGIKNFAKGFASGVTGTDAPAAKTNAAPAAKTNPTLDPIKASISKLNPKQLAALRTQIAKKAGVV